MKVRIPNILSKKISSSFDVYEIMKTVYFRQNKLHRQKEYFWVIGLNNASDILYIELIAIGSLNKVSVDPVEVFSFAVAKKCKRIILVHNHPSNNPEPSKADIKFMDEFVRGGKLLRIDIVDHIIITEIGYSSFKDLKYLDKNSKL
ncbi:MAG TPA: JAB domain-containing protein [Cytophagaceae bacterium]|jgi:DNA repair protein RadC|nr:JAB domain-containing protein [Cytophagaceae bacterium]